MSMRVVKENAFDQLFRLSRQTNKQAGLLSKFSEFTLNLSMRVLILDSDLSSFSLL